MRMARLKDGDGIKSNLIIAEVQKRPILYDASHQAYGERVLKTQCWEQVCAAVLPQWDSMSASERHASGKEIQKRWRSIRDSYTKAYRQGKCAPSGGGAGGRRSQHKRQMAFLYQALQRRVARTSTDKRLPDLDSTSTPPPTDSPLNVKLENNNEEPPPAPPAKTYQNSKKRQDAKIPSVETSQTEEKTLETKEAPSLKHAATETIQDFRSQEMRSFAELMNPSLEIKIDANAILPEDHFEDDRLFMNSLLPFFKKMDDVARLSCRIEVLKIIKEALEGKSFEVARQPEEVAKEELKAAGGSLNEDVSSQSRFGRKRTLATLYNVPPKPAPKRRGPGRPRKTSPPRWKEQKRPSDSEEEPRRRRRRAPARLEREAEREREWESRLTPDEEEMYRATSVAQLKPPQFLKMYNLEPTKKPATAPPAPELIIKKETS